MKLTTREEEEIRILESQPLTAVGYQRLTELRAKQKRTLDMKVEYLSEGVLVQASISNTSFTASAHVVVNGVPRGNINGPSLRMVFDMLTTKYPKDA